MSRILGRRIQSSGLHPAAVRHLQDQRAALALEVSRAPRELEELRRYRAAMPTSTSLKRRAKVDREIEAKALRIDECRRLIVEIDQQLTAFVNLE